MSYVKNLRHGIKLGRLLGPAGNHQQGIQYEKFTQAVMLNLSLVPMGTFLMPHEAKKLVYMKPNDEPVVVRIKHCATPMFWYSNKLFVIFAGKEDPEDVILHEMGHFQCKHHTMGKSINRPIIRQMIELEANLWAIANGARPEILANGFHTYLKPMPYFVRRLICKLLIGAEPSDPEMYETQATAPDEWLSAWEHASRKGL